MAHLSYSRGPPGSQRLNERWMDFIRPLVTSRNCFNEQREGIYFHFLQKKVDFFPELKQKTDISIIPRRHRLSALEWALQAPNMSTRKHFTHQNVKKNNFPDKKLNFLQKNKPFKIFRRADCLLCQKLNKLWINTIFTQKNILTEKASKIFSDTNEILLN